MTGAYEAASSALLALPALLAGLAALAAARLGPGGWEWDYSASAPGAWRGSRTLLAALLAATAAAAGFLGAIAGVEWGVAALAAGLAASHAALLEASRRMAERALLSQPPTEEAGWEPLEPPAPLMVSSAALALASAALLALSLRAGLPPHAAAAPASMAGLQAYYAALLARGTYPYPPPPRGVSRLLALAGLHAPGLAAALAGAAVLAS